MALELTVDVCLSERWTLSELIQVESEDFALSVVSALVFLGRGR